MTNLKQITDNEIDNLFDACIDDESRFIVIEDIVYPINNNEELELVVEVMRDAGKVQSRIYNGDAAGYRERTELCLFVKGSTWRIARG